jgi:hypothetical protein
MLLKLAVNKFIGMTARMVEPRFIAERIRRDVRKMPRSRKTASTMSPRTTQFVSGLLPFSIFYIISIS